VRTVDQCVMNAPATLCFQVAADVENWPAILEHYRWVRFERKDGFGTGVVGMSAWRRFPLGINYPTWWVSEMHIARAEPAVYYRHVRGITRGMAVKWSFDPLNTERTHVRIVHEWTGPNWPLIRWLAANLVIGPHFVSAIAQRTLAGVAREAERRAAQGVAS
jgi:hypothetical protein